MKPRHYVRTTLTVPEVGQAIHVAELEEIDTQSCTMVRIIELAPDGTIMGASGNGRSAGVTTTPNTVVPHPNTYSNYPDLEAEFLTPAEFEALWSEASAKFSDLN